MNSDKLLSLFDSTPLLYELNFRNEIPDLAFVAGVLAAEGIGWRIEEHADSPAGHRLALFADSTRTCAVPEDATSAGMLCGTGEIYCDRQGYPHPFSLAGSSCCSHLLAQRHISRIERRNPN